MIAGIDVGTSQRNLDFGLARRLGFEICYVKLGGSNTGTRYVAPWYASQGDRARAVGMRVGHYWVPNPNLDVAGDGRFFAGNLRGWTPADFIVLDNERLDAAPRLLTDDEAALWFRTVQAATGIPTAAMFMYAGAADLRGRAWPAVRALGVKLIVAMYGQNNGSYPGEPNLGGRWPDWAGHQYSSQGNIGGIIIDLNVFKPDAFATAGPAGGITGPIDNKPTEEDVKIIRVNGGSIALVGEYTGNVYTAITGGQGFSIGSNTKAFGEVTGLTEDELSTLVNEARNRRAGLIADVAAKVTAPAVDVTSITAALVAAIKAQGVTVDVAAIAAAVDVVVADNFAALPAAVVDLEANRLRE